VPGISQLVKTVMRIKHKSFHF